MSDHQTQKNRVVIIGIDGVPYDLIDKFSTQDIMLNMKELRKDGHFCKLRSSIPEVSSVAWSSIITGQNPGTHGIFGFTDLIFGTYSLRFPNFKDLKSVPFWEKDPSQSSIIINVPSSYPPRKMNGIHIAGFVAPDLYKAVYPPNILPLLEKCDYRVDVDVGKIQKSYDLFIDDLFRTMESRIKIIDQLWDRANWDIFMAVFTGSDRLEHFLWDAFENEDHPHRKAFLDFFRRIDDAIGMIIEKLRSTDQLMILSDHGMERVQVEVNLNNFLTERGFLHLSSDPKKRYNNIKLGSKAFALDPSRIYLNKRNKYPNGSVFPSEEEGILDELITEFSTLKWEGERVIEKIFRCNEIYHGDSVKDGPNLVLIPKSGFNLRGRIGQQSIFETPSIFGKHTLDDAFLYVWGNENSAYIPNNPNVEHIVQIIEALR